MSGARSLAKVKRYWISNNHSRVKRMVINAGWMIFDNILNISVSLCIGIWMARYLGPNEYGQLNYASAYIALATVFVGFGMKDIVIREIVFEPAIAGEIIGTAGVLQLVFGLIAYLSVIGMVSLLQPNDTLTLITIVILGTLLLVKWSDCVVYWFESQIDLKPVVLTQKIVLVFFAFIKALMLYMGASYIEFVCVLAIEGLTVAIGLATIFRQRCRETLSLKVNLYRAFHLLKKSWPLALAGVSIIVNTRIDQLLIGSFLGTKEVGIYSVAIKMCELWYIVPTIVLTSTYPYLLRNSAEGDNQTSEAWTILYSFMLWISLMAGIAIAFLSEPIIICLFGEEFAPSAEPLKILVWCSLSVTLGTVWSKWIVSENMGKIILYAQLNAAIMNAIMNYVLLPEYGINGSASATLISFSLSALISFFMYKPKFTFQCLFNSLNPIALINKKTRTT